VNKTASSRAFGLLLTVVCAALAALSYWAQVRGYVFWGVATVLLLAVSLTMPRLLGPAKRAWLKFGRVLHLVLNPVILGTVYLLVFIPFGLVARLVGKDPLALRRNPSAKTYWIERSKRPDAQSLRDQF
jgi:hypothetical protein